MVLDALDHQLLGALQENARLSYRKLAALVDSTVPTVSARVARMEQLGIIAGYTVVLADSPRPTLPKTGETAVACHTCAKTTTEPVISRIGDRLHPFCCGTCESSFRQRHDRISQGQ